MKKVTNYIVYSLIGLAWIFFLFISCRKVGISDNSTSVIDLGKISSNTAIKSIVQTGNTVTAEFSTTPGAKYSVQITPFGSDVPVKAEGFTAADSVTKKVYNLDSLAKKNYDLHLLDVTGKEIKYPITIK